MRALPDSIAVIGLGVSGMAAARYVMSHRADHPGVSLALYDSSASDELVERTREFVEAGVRVTLGADALDEPCDLAIVSPGIPPRSPLHISARANAARVVGELEFAFERSHSPWLAITGTNGKTTVTSLCAHLLTSAGVPAEAVGNIGDPAIALVDELGPSTALVAEVSSFQLALTETFRPRVAVLLNITPDHIDWHGSLEAYAADKARLFRNMGPDDTAVIDVDDPGSAPYAQHLEDRGISVIRVSRRGLQVGGAGVVDGILVLSTQQGTVPLMPASELKIRGDHNVSNALAAAAAAHAWGIDSRAIARGLSSFEPIEHRLEPAGSVLDVEYINDSKATNPGASLMALTAYQDHPVILLLGGRNKGSDFVELAVTAGRATKSVIVFGEAANEIARALESVGVEYALCETMLHAVTRASEIAEPGDAVLLSPACASFDEFDGYSHRGRVFKAAVAQMSSKVQR